MTSRAGFNAKTMPTKISEEQIQTAAQTVTAAKAKLVEAKAAADAAGGVDTQLNAAVTDAQKAITDAEAIVADLSQKKTAYEKFIGKQKIKKADIDRTLREAGELSDDDDDDETDTEDPNRVVTAGELAKKTFDDLANAVGGDEATAIQTARSQVNPTLLLSNPQAAFQAARAIVNADRNAKIILEANRKNPTRTVTSGAGAPPKQEETIELTAEEMKYTHPPFSLSPEEIVKTRR